MYDTPRPLRVALASSVAFTLCIGACSPSPDAAVEQTLALRDGGFRIRCGGDEEAPITVIRGRRTDRFGFLQRVPSACRVDLSVPERSRLHFGVAFAGTRKDATREARATLTAAGKTGAEQTFEAALVAGRRPAAGEISLPAGRVTLTFEAVASSQLPADASLAWTDLVVRTRDPGFAGALPWTTDVQRALAPYFEGTDAPSRAPGKRRLLIIGIDGASWDRMQPLLAAGEMPALASLQRRGRWGVLRSTVVPESAMSWTAIRTGVGPGRNGTYTFLSPPTPRRSFWHLLGDHGLRSVIVAVPKASPDRPLSGILVGGWTEQRRDEFTQPKELKPHLLRAGYDPSLVNMRNVGYYAERMRRRTQVARQLLAHTDWDLAFVVYEHSDTVAHRFGLRSREWNQVYRAVDGEIAALLEAADEQTAILLVSDHGWKAYPRSLNVGAWLGQNAHGEWKANLPMSGNATGISSADAPSGAVPADGREPHAEALERLTRDLLAISDPRDGTKVVARVRAADGAFEGPYAAWAPGRLLVELDAAYRAQRGSRSPVAFGAKPREHHSHEGIYLLAGPGIEPGPGAEQSVFDVAPTVLRFFGIAPPDDAEGRSMHDFGVAGSLAAAGEPYFAGSKQPTPPGRAEVSPELEEGLRALGYIE